MTNFVDTETEGQITVSKNENIDAELLVWLQDNNFMDVIPMFKVENITLKELISMGEDMEYLRQYLLEINISKSLVTRITFRIKKVVDKKADNEQIDDNNDDNKDKRRLINQ